MPSNNPGVVVPPPLIFAGALAAGAGLDAGLGVLPLGLSPRARLLWALPLAVAGGALIVAALGGFVRAGTRPEPWRATTAVVTTGIYRFTRNPMYLGMALIYVAVALGIGSGLALILLGPVLAVIQHAVIGREERYLDSTFGEPYRLYAASVRRWF